MMLSLLALENSPWVAILGRGRLFVHLTFTQDDRREAFGIAILADVTTCQFPQSFGFAISFVIFTRLIAEGSCHVCRRDWVVYASCSEVCVVVLAAMVDHFATLCFAVLHSNVLPPTCTQFSDKCTLSSLPFALRAWHSFMKRARS